MRTTDFTHILRGVTELAGIPYADLTTVQFETFRTFADRRLALSWEAERWPELCRLEQRWYRADYAAGTTYAALAEVYYAAEDKYYIALKASTGNAPTDTAYWAESATSYAGDDWVTATAYVAEDIVFYPATNKFYQCHTAHTSSSTLVPDATGGNNRWGELVPLDKYVAYAQTGETAIGDVFEIWSASPKLTTRARTINWQLSENGAQVNTDLTSVWISYRIRRSRFTGSTWSASTAYTTGQQSYYEASGTGNFYTALQSTTNNNPSSSSSYWSVVDIPYIFEQYLIRGVYADWLTSDGQNDKAMQSEMVADGYLIQELDKLYRQQGQVYPIKVSNY